jgi:chromosomal replication initiation ATPase DnaA
MSRARFIASITGRPIEGWTIETIITAVSRETGIHRRAILSADRSKDVTAARHEAMRRAHATGRYSLSQIGRAMKRDHTSVVNGIRRAIERKFK